MPASLRTSVSDRPISPFQQRSANSSRDGLAALDFAPLHYLVRLVGSLSTAFAWVWKNGAAVGALSAAVFTACT
jgi:hypothetical protein